VTGVCPCDESVCIFEWQCVPRENEIFCMKIVSNAENLCVVFLKNCVLELQFECKARIMLVVHQNWFRGLVNELHVVTVSQVPEFVCKRSRKTVTL